MFRNNSHSRLGSNNYRIFIIGILTIVVGLFITFEFTVDDAFITFRYAQNLASGHGFVWNIGEPPVEGFTHFLWIILMAIPELIGVSSECFAKYFGSLSLFIVFFVLYIGVNNISGGRFGGMVAIIPLIFNFNSYLHAVSGLETMLYSLVLLFVFLIVLFSISLKHMKHFHYEILLPFLTIILGMLRPEGILPGCYATTFIYFYRKDLRRNLLYASCVSFVIGFLYMVWRIWYFGAFFPNPFYFKMVGHGVAIPRLLRALTTFIPTLFLSLITLRSLNKQKDAFKVVITFFVTFFVASIIAYAFASGEMDYADRFLYPSFALIITILGISAGLLKQCKSKIVVCILVIISMLPFISKPVYILLNYGPVLRAAHGSIGDELRKANIPKEDKTLAVSDAGIIPYLSQWNTVDYSGLNEPKITQRHMDPTELIINKNPTIVIFPSSDGFNPHPISFHVNTAQVMMKYRYKLGSVYFNRNNWLLVYIKNESSEPIRQELSSRIKLASDYSVIKNRAFSNNREKAIYVIYRWKQRLLGLESQ